jgi:hypothetical protein
VIKSDRARNQKGLTYGDGSIEERLTRPDAFQQSTLIPKYDMKDPETAAGRENPLGDYPAHAGHFLTHLGAGQRCQGRSVDVAMGEVPEEIAGGPDAQARQPFSAALSYALEELDRSLQAERRRCPGRH